jgi:GNAT superfamily N-acetyltransferase
VTRLLASGGAARALIERVHRGGSALAEEYPLVFAPRSGGRLIALGDGDDAHSACTLLVRDFVMEDEIVRCGLVGSVATHPDRRRQGLATWLLVEAETALAGEGCVLAMLWAEDPLFYLARGWCPIGAERDLVLPATLSASLPRAEGVRPLAPGDAPAVHALYERHAARVARTSAETEALLGCPGMQVLVREREGAVAAYACLGRGLDLADAIHEWGGAVDDVLALVRAHLEQRFPPGSGGNGRLFLMAPEGAELARALEAAGAEGHAGILALGRILDRPAAAALLDRRLAPAGGARAIETDDGPRFLVSGPAGEAALDDDGLLALLLPAVEVRDEVLRFLEGFGLASARVPLSAFAWGLDSI